MLEHLIQYEFAILDSFPYTNIYGDDPVLSFCIGLLSHNASINFLYQFIWLTAIVFLRIWINVCDSAKPFPWG
jgi:hypothetical protein